MNKRRLNTLADYLSTVPKKHFHLSSWVEIDGGTSKNGAIDTVGCGTTCCAFGWACSIPSFRRAGLKMDFQENVPVFKDKEDFEAAQDFFGITETQAEWLFSPTYYSRPRMANPRWVIERLRDLTGEQMKFDKHKKQLELGRMNMGFRNAVCQGLGR